VFPVYVLKKGTELPETGTYYIVAKDGVFLRKDTGLIKATVKVNRVSFLEELEPTATFNLPRVPSETLVRVLLFFRSVYRRSKSEAVVLAHYCEETRNYFLSCPNQLVTEASVRYKSDERFEGHQLVGSFHSHPGFGAFHSGIDRGDEEHFDGFHVTIGRVDQPYFNISCSLVVNNNRFLIDPEGLIIGISEVDWKPAPRVTYRRRNIPRDNSYSESGGFFEQLLAFDESQRSFEAVLQEDPSQFYEVVLPEGKDYRHVGFPKSWMRRVIKRSLLQQLVAPDFVTQLTPEAAKGGRKE